MKSNWRTIIVVFFAIALTLSLFGCTIPVKIRDVVNVNLVGISPAPAPGYQDSNDCAYDRDCDGFTDSMEAQGFTLTGTNNLHFPTCNGEVTEGCVDPDSRDLFVILERASSNSLIPTTSPSFMPFEFITKGRTQGGLGISVHEVSITGGDISSSNDTVGVMEGVRVRP